MLILFISAGISLVNSFFYATYAPFAASESVIVFFSISNYAIFAFDEKTPDISFVYVILPLAFEMVFIIVLAICIVILRRSLHKITYTNKTMYASHANYSIIVLNIRYQKAKSVALSVLKEFGVQLHSVLTCRVPRGEIKSQRKLNVCAKYLRFAKECRNNRFLYLLAYFSPIKIYFCFFF